MREFIRGRESFAFETTCAGRAYLPMLQTCKADDWRVTLVFLWLPSLQDAVERVARRVQQGGHNIPSDVIVRRYWAGLSNMRLLYLPQADVAMIYDNSDEHGMLIARRSANTPFVVYDADRWAKIEKARS
jgi:predicted ABC-type ATPase